MPASAESLQVVAHLALVARNTKVMYLPTPKAACTTIKLMLATAEGTHRPEVADRLAVMHVSRAQTIHHPEVHGLTRLADLSAREQAAVLTSPDWLRVASLRDPVARAYSAWENRIFMRAHRRTKVIIELAHDVVVDGRVDLAASFAHFARVLGEHGDTFMTDHHFQPQALLVHPETVNYTRLVRVDQPGEIDGLARVLSERSGKQVTATRLNEGLGVKVDRVCDAHTANRLMATYATDYDTFGFARREWPPTVEPLFLGEMESRLLANYRNVFERSISVAQESQRRVGARYGFGQMTRGLKRALRGEHGPRDPREVQP
ncbi:MAG: sulfotransferase family 2 domain-containing protein [Ilumatobacteraceae bacterium]